jgi:O-antigen/teichoic acid export membrane protein
MSGPSDPGIESDGTGASRSGWFVRGRTELRALTEGPLVRNAASLYGSTIVTSALGFFYWFMAARLLPAASVGIASAIQSAAQLLSVVCVLGLSTLLISELSVDRTHARSLMLTASTVVVGVTTVAALAVAFVVGQTSSNLHEGLSGPAAVIVFVLLSALTAEAVVLDDSCVGLLRGDIQLRRNTVFAVSKLLILPALIVLWPTKTGTELVLAWLIGLAISLVLLAMRLDRLTSGQPSHLIFGHLFDRRRAIAGHHWLNISIYAPRQMLPIIVATIVGPAPNAAFTAALLVIGFVNIIPVHLSTVLFALAPGDEVALRREVRKTMRICLALALASAPFFLVFSRLILGAFGTGYQSATTALILLGLTTYPLAVKTHYVAISRVRGRMARASVRTLVGGCIEIGLAALGGVRGGITGVALGYLAASVIEASLFAPTVFRVLSGAPGVDPEDAPAAGDDPSGGRGDGGS